MVVEILQQVVYGTPSGTSSSCTSRAGSYGSGIHAGVSRSGAASQPASSYGGSNPGAPGLGSGLFGSGPGTLAIYSSKSNRMRSPGLIGAVCVPRGGAVEEV